jgi:hypothetical protein
MQDWIEQHLIPNCSTWSEMKEMFKEKYFDPEIKERLIGQLEKCVQAMGERVHQYTERFQSLVVRISSGTPIDTQTNIISCERGFIPAIRQELAKYRSMMTQQQRSTFEFAKLSDLYETAANTERGLAPRTGKVGSTSLSNNNSRKRSFNGRQKRTQLNAVSSTSVAAATPVVNKIEMNEQGQPVNVNKKHKAPQQTSSFSARGAGRGRGGGRAGRGGFGGGGRPVNGSSSSSSPFRGRGGRGGRGRTDPASTSSTYTFGGSCFGCGERGHRQSDCPRHDASSSDGGRP